MEIFLSTKVAKTLADIHEQNKKLLDFTRIATHNLRSHSSNLSGILNILNKATTEKEKLELLNYLQDISTGFKETLDNLDEIAAVQWNAGVEKEKLNLLKAVNRAIKVLKFNIKQANAIVNIDISKSINLKFNAAYLDSIILNLISNAIKYRHPKRKLIITISAEMKQNKLFFSVSDNGVGIDLNKHKHDIFGLYKTFTNHSEAKGYGLYITKCQVEAMGGSIEAKTNEKFGTRFEINFIYEGTISN